jgi:DNA mismatch endonuclease (patch repair protein)
LPSTRREFWETKIFQNVRRDSKNKKMLLDSGWRVATFWECAIRDKSAVEINKAIRRLATWLKAGNDGSNEIEVRDP